MPAAGPPPEVSPAAVAMMTQREPTCTWPARRSATDVSIFLRADITDAQRAALQAALRADPVVQGLQYESRDAAYQKFKVLWRDSPDFVAAVDADSMPESFRFELARPSEYPAFAARLKSQAGVQDLVGGVCP
jgi:cell division protein FtsX